MHDRLTELIRRSDILCDTCGESTSSYCSEAIADYLIEHGVIIPPCRVGDTVYQTDGIRVYDLLITQIIYNTNGIAFDERAIGKAIFLTREEAEQAVKGGE